MLCCVCLLYCWLTSFLSFILYMMGSPLDRGNGGGQLWSWALVWWCLLVVFLKLILNSACRDHASVLAWTDFYEITPSTPVVLYINFVFLCVCVCVCVRASSCHVLKMGHQCGIQYAAPNGLWILFSLWSFSRSKWLGFFSLVKEIRC